MIAQRSIAAAATVPWIGLQLSPLITEMDWYGPPTSPADYPTQAITVSADLDHSRAVNWQFWQDWFFPAIEVVSGPQGGTLNPGDEATMELAPAALAVQSQGITTQYPTWHRDDTYQTMHPILHTFYVGLEGFQLSPQTDFVGAGPGALPFETETYSVMNRWVVGQDVEVSADVGWVRFNGSSGPLTVSLLPAKGSEVELSLDATGIPKGIHAGTITWTSLDSGVPNFARTTGVMMDVGRQIYGGPYAPPLAFTIDNANPVEDIPVAVGGILPGTVEDADVLVSLTVSVSMPGGVGLDMSLVSPTGTSVGLSRKVLGSLNQLYDDTTNPPTGGGLMADFNGENYFGDWILRLQRDAGDTRTYDASLSHLEVRLYVGASP